MIRSGLMKCRLTRITKNRHTRTEVIEGECDSYPTEGSPFVMWNDKPLLPVLGATGRYVETSPVAVASRKHGNTIAFKTQFTEYIFEELV